MRGLTPTEVDLLDDAAFPLTECPGDCLEHQEDRMSPEQSAAIRRLQARALVVPWTCPCRCTYYDLTPTGRLALRIHVAIAALETTFSGARP